MSANLYPLKPGDTIGLISPSSPMREGRLALGVEFLQKKGFNVKLGQHVEDSERFLAGTDQHRAQDIMQFFQDPSVKAIMATAGGYGSQRLLSLLDYDVIQKNPKPIIGFSDTTALQLGILKKTNLISYTGFTFRDLDAPILNPLIHDTLMHCLNKKNYVITEGTTAQKGKAQGKLMGANLSLIIALMGTPYQPDFTGNILLIEDVFSEPFMIDCRLSQLELAGVFDQVTGVIFGQFAECYALHNPERDGSVENVIDEWCARLRVPCIKNFPYGHGERRCVLPLGAQVILNADLCQLEINWSL